METARGYTFQTRNCVVDLLTFIIAGKEDILPNVVAIQTDFPGKKTFYFKKLATRVAYIRIRPMFVC